MMLECNLSTVLLAIIGFLTLLYFFAEVLWSITLIIKALLAPYMTDNGEELNNTLKRYGEWALVTGCTDGIGLEYAKELASKGHSIILVSRTKSKLEAVAAEIEGKFRVKTKIICVDFGNGPAAINHIRNEIGKIEVSILVNNVGTQYDYPMYVGEVPEQVLWNIININIGAVTLLTRIFIEDMKQRGKGAIVNVSSGSELQPLPLMTVYGASKVYIRNFTEALRYEYKDSNLTIQHLIPMFINTKMNKFSDRLQKSNLLVPDAKTYAKHAVNTLGKLDTTTGYWAHGVQVFFMKLTPEWLNVIIGGRMNKSFRAEYFKNLQKK